ncbi:MAG: glycosyltransferase family 39 protein [Thermodesulfobacteriota bacterium]
MKRPRPIRGALTLLLVLALVGALLLAGLGDMALTDRDEGEYAASVAAMVKSGDYIVPTLNGRPYLEKPILIFWTMAGAQRLLGPGEIAARLPSALAGFLLVLAVGLFVWRISGRPGLGAVAAACLGLCPLFLLVGRACLTDMLLSLFTTLALFWFFWATEKEPPADRGWYLAAWAALALGFLTKGPVALAVVLPCALIYAIWQRRLLAVLKRGQLLWGLVILLAVNLPWYGLVWYKLGSQFWQAFFVSQNLRRFSETLLGHGGGLAYYLPVLLIGAFPFVAAALPELGRSLAQNPRAQRRVEPMARLHLFSALALLWTLVVFTLAATKQINYILPGLPFLAILAGCSLDRLARGETGGRLARSMFWIALLGLSALVALALTALPVAVPLFWGRVEASLRFDSSEYALPFYGPVLLGWPLLAAATLVAMCLLLIWLYRSGRDRPLPWIMGAGAAVFCALIFLGLLPQAAGYIQEPAKQMALEVAQRTGGKGRVVTFGLWKPSLIFYSGRELPRLRVDQAAELVPELAKEAPLFIMTRVRLLEALDKHPGFSELSRYGGYLLGGNQAALRLWRGRAAQTAPSAAPQAPVTGSGL